FLSGLLFALPLLNEASELELTTALESASYVDMTRAALSEFGIRQQGWHIVPQGYRSPGYCAVEGDWSNAAFWLCAGAISRGVTVTGLNPDSPQGDRKILAVLENFGAAVSRKNGAITVEPRPLRAGEVDARDIPDLVPPIALLAACAEGKTRISGAERLKIKESDRLQSVARTLKALGGQVEVTQDGLLITGSRLSGGKVDSFQDHRIAMLAAIASCRCTGSVILTGAEAVKKSYPRFWEDFSRMQKEELI
ncbi:MAG: 3-phosphoshikimate 1-carboxyvinyltransferase, partial [Oscillospiraceae bacterium]|nr:3-phosphoshikimate 1-carboxyvinyltransferase [Oscillospiraceae bacterium]